MAVTSVSIGRSDSQSAGPLLVRLDGGRTYHLWIQDVGLACCAVEFIAATMRGEHLDAADNSARRDETETADVLVVSGTVTDQMAPAIKRLYDRMPEPRYVISFGSCANCGGPYWDSYCVTKGVDQIIPVDVYVPGCPPRPEALLDGLAELNAKVTT